MHVFPLPCVVCVLMTVFFNMAATKNRKFAFGNHKPKLLLNRTLTFTENPDFFGDPRLSTSTLDLLPSTFYSRPSTFDPRHLTLDPRHLTLDKNPDSCPSVLVCHSGEVLE